MDSYQRDVRMLTVEILKLMNTESHSDEELERAKSALEAAARALRHEEPLPLAQDILKFSPQGKDTLTQVEGATRSLQASEPRPVAAC